MAISGPSKFILSEILQTIISNKHSLQDYASFENYYLEKKRNNSQHSFHTYTSFANTTWLW